LDGDGQCAGTRFDDDLAGTRRGNDEGGYPEPGPQTVLSCLHVVTDEEWWHHQYATRDLAVLIG